MRYYWILFELNVLRKQNWFLEVLTQQLTTNTYISNQFKHDKRLTEQLLEMLPHPEIWAFPFLNVIPFPDGVEISRLEEISMFALWAPTVVCDLNTELPAHHRSVVLQHPPQCWPPPPPLWPHIPGASDRKVSHSVKAIMILIADVIWPFHCLSIRSEASDWPGGWSE